MIYYAGSDVPKEWYKAEYDVNKYPFFEFKFIKTCVVEKAHGIVFIKALDGLPGVVLSVDKVDDCKIDFPSNIITRGDMKDAINNWCYHRSH